MLKRLLSVSIIVVLLAAACGDTEETTTAATVIVEWGSASNINQAEMIAQRFETCVPALSTLFQDCLEVVDLAKGPVSLDQHVNYFSNIAASLPSVITRDVAAETCLYRPFQIMVVGDAEAAEDVIAAATGLDITLLEEPPEEFTALELNPAAPAGATFVYSQNVDPYDEVVQLINDGQNVGVHYVFIPTPRWRFGPAGAPLPVSPNVLTDAPQPTNNGAGAVLILDTDDSISGTQLNDPAFGHSTFIESVVIEFGSGLTVNSQPAVNNDGLIDEGTLDAAYATAPVETGQRQDLVLNMSFGTFPCAGVPPVGLDLTMTTIAGDGALVVAAAGNDDTDQPFFPAAYAVDATYGEFVVSVGADMVEVNADGSTASSEADFSNFGDWVEVWAPGVNVVGQYPSQVTQFVYTEDVSVSDNVSVSLAGAVQWDGTSFAAPFVAAMIASRTAGGTVRAACEQLLGDAVCKQ